MHRRHLSALSIGLVTALAISVLIPGVAEAKTATLRPDGDVTHIAWLGFVDSDDDGILECVGDDCCATDCYPDNWKAIDEPFADRYDLNENLTANTTVTTPTYRCTFSDLGTSANNVKVSRIEFKFGRLHFDVGDQYGDLYINLTVRYFIDGVEEGSDVISCNEGDACDGADTDQSVVFSGLSHDLDEINSLELQLEATGELGPLVGYVAVHQVEAKVNYLEISQGSAP